MAECAKFRNRGHSPVFGDVPALAFGFGSGFRSRTLRASRHGCLHGVPDPETGYFSKCAKPGMSPFPIPQRLPCDQLLVSSFRCWRARVPSDDQDECRTVVAHGWLRRRRCRTIGRPHRRASTGMRRHGVTPILVLISRAATGLRNTKPHNGIELA
jgi:hypothetical protein